MNFHRPVHLVAYIPVTAAPLSDKQAERMPGRVEHDPDTLLRLVVSQCGASLDGPGDSRVEIVDRDVQMDRDVLLACLARPDRRGVLSFVLEVQRGAGFAVRRTQLRPAVLRWETRPCRFFDGDRPAEHPCVKGSEIARGRRADGH